MRVIRRLIQAGLPLLGTVLILAAVLLLVELRLQLFVVLIGILLLQAGVWQLAQSFLPNQRKYKPLREEVDRFVNLVRRLNGQALRLQAADSPELREEVAQTRDAMLQSVDRMLALAGKTESETEG